jgi:hypothetical protein
MLEASAASLIWPEAHRRAGPFTLGARLALATFVVTQFVDLTLLDVGGIQLTAQKSAAVALLPMAVILMRRLRISRSLIFLGVTLAFAYSIAHLWQGDLGPPLLNGLFGLSGGMVTAVVLYTALCEAPGCFGYFAAWWVAASVVTGAVMVLQALNVLPLFVVPESDLPARLALSGLYRATGFKYDPNIAALMLVIGLAFAFGTSGRRSALSRALIGAGIVTTFSRMGILAGLGMFLLAGFKNRRGIAHILRRAIGMLVAVLLISASVTAGALLAAPEIARYLSERFGEVVVTYEQVMAGGVPPGRGRHLTSSEARVLLAKGALDTAMSHWLTGVGAYATEDAIFEEVSLHNVAHNTYLELFLIGGLSGLACVWVYYAVVAGALRAAKNRPDLSEARYVVFAAAGAVACGSLFLSITYTSLLWVPAFLAAALRYQARCVQAHQGGDCAFAG